ncbi:hypothetical protein POX_d05869 [Penicillium oxalicum]|uniref:hypothetical protein n=1 Tax=Penicillium oxalicum TaxID=69781 RepID=UPI0020B8A4D1|nr:hypothetical protein POX_d05869 [Penicillium oxalicum]KAI2790358.1 hypothetical protein POX_d05869 [Penicillium oxalicum]
MTETQVLRRATSSVVELTAVHETSRYFMIPSTATVQEEIIQATRHPLCLVGASTRVKKTSAAFGVQARPGKAYRLTNWRLAPEH